MAIDSRPPGARLAVSPPAPPHTSPPQPTDPSRRFASDSSPTPRGAGSRTAASSLTTSPSGPHPSRPHDWSRRFGGCSTRRASPPATVLPADTGGPAAGQMKSPAACKDATGPSSCPSRARTWTLLIQSQACCQLHQGAVGPSDERKAYEKIPGRQRVGQPLNSA